MKNECAKEIIKEILNTFDSKYVLDTLNKFKKYNKKLNFLNQKDQNFIIFCQDLNSQPELLHIFRKDKAKILANYHIHLDSYISNLIHAAGLSNHSKGAKNNKHFKDHLRSFSDANDIYDNNQNDQSHFKDGIIASKTYFMHKRSVINSIINSVHDLNGQSKEIEDKLQRMVIQVDTFTHKEHDNHVYHIGDKSYKGINDLPDIASEIKTYNMQVRKTLETIHDNSFLTNNDKKKLLNKLTDSMHKLNNKVANFISPNDNNQSLRLEIQQKNLRNEIKSLKLNIEVYERSISSDAYQYNLEKYAEDKKFEYLNHHLLSDENLTN